MLSTWKDIRENNWRTFHVSLIVKDLEKTLAYYQSLDLISSILQSGNDRHVHYEEGCCSLVFQPLAQQ